MIGAFVAVLTCIILNTLIPNLCYTEEAWTSFGEALVCGLTMFNWVFILYQFTPLKRKRKEAKERKKNEEKQYYFNQEVIKEQAKIQATFDAEAKAKLENEIELTKLWIEKNKITDAQEELINLKRKETNQKERELQVKEDKFSEIETELEKTKAELEAIYDTEVYKLGVQAVERKKMTANLKKFILERDDYTCQVCGASLHNDFNLKLEVDHIVPISKGGKTDPSNLQTLCRKCNRSKGAKSMEVFVGAK